MDLKQHLYKCRLIKSLFKIKTAHVNKKKKKNKFSKHHAENDN